ncbi:MAG: TfoX/Sxy family protein [Alphaproteobacteria bacterium]|nr:TfoX/Sxy family protein [Alphaproteobacteria bacterium]
MATNKDFFDHVLDTLSPAGDISYKKMFGEYGVYKNGRMIMLVCDNTVFVRQLPEVAAVFAKYKVRPESEVPYEGAKEYFIVDMDNQPLACDLAELLSRILPLPKPRKKKSA